MGVNYNGVKLLVENKHITDLNTIFEDYLTIKDVSETTGIPYTTLRRHIKNPRDFTVGELKLIAAVLELPFLSIAALIEGSLNLHEKG